jgi:2-polyprenyl-6-methoxyphenol hydroxylase-like FAD-dependent oxidoreductase
LIVILSVLFACDSFDVNFIWLRNCRNMADKVTAMATCKGPGCEGPGCEGSGPTAGPASEYPSQRAAPAAPHVLVIGAGIAGSCLAQSLKRRGVSVAVYERESSAEVRNQGYRIGLSGSGVEVLRECLAPNLFELCAATALAKPERRLWADPQLRPARLVPRSRSGGIAVNRLTLREILLADLDKELHFGKNLAAFASCPDGRVTAQFTDGTSATGDLLVGADGTGSTVRRIVAPEAVIDELHWEIYGRTVITAALLASVPSVLLDTYAWIIAPGGDAMNLSACAALRPASTAAAELAPGVRLTDVPDYFRWMVGPFDDSLRGADSDALHRMVVEKTSQWHPAVRRIVAEADRQATFAARMGSARPIAVWSAANVTLMGDAVHTMSPGRGAATGVALQDALVLSRALAEVATGRLSLSQAKAGYEEQMLTYAFDEVARSLARPIKGKNHRLAARASVGQPQARAGAT